jgi:hypothetical protein
MSFNVSVSKEFRIFHTEELCDVYRSPNSVRVVTMLLKLTT